MTSASSDPGQPMDRICFGVLGELTDKFGKRWMVAGDLSQEKIM
jgi:hypothetical protein